jgi:hypothetical protein
MDIENLSRILDIDEDKTKKLLKYLSITIALNSVKPNITSTIPYIGSFTRKGNKFFYEESDYVKNLRTNKMSIDEYLKIMISDE